MERTGVIIAAGGSGTRCGGTLPKQFALLGGMPVLARTINVCAEALPGAEIVVVLPERYTAFWTDFAARFDVAKHHTATGGAERFDSVRRGIEALRSDPELIAVQDGVRPLASVGMIRRVAADAAHYGAAIPVIAVQRNRDKVSRANDILPYVAAGRFYVPEGVEWADPLINEICAFSPAMTHAHDDQVDTVVDAIDTLLMPNGGMLAGADWS